MDRITTRDRPTIATLLTAFVTALVSWGWSALPDTVPDEVATAGYALVLAVVAVVVGKVTQGEWLERLAGDHAPWAVDTHTAAVAYALSLDPDEHPIYGEDADTQLRAVGIDDLAGARRAIGIDDEATS